jgi:hypothetical protein
MYLIKISCGAKGKVRNLKKASVLKARGRRKIT